ncbi:HNH endonuclease [Pseudolysobacter antarcticus]|uniref:HNH endonuclease n=1 Tax=Pseudolysobacter antarcticus TaxID=2511995 RepID=A0A411HNW6_9GAMM|nr:HNH endonuclease [Pseudolysobacter antarcticus]QBB72166.1 HNH endonuclease [Pseudolysobacter antarcticus]
MRYWWVNQKQTYRHEVPGGYLWSPKLKSNGSRNPFYDFMREVAPGDIVFSFADTFIKAIGIIASHAYEAPKPAEFGAAGIRWDRIGWRVDVRFAELISQTRPSDHMARLSRLLPTRYAPLRENGHGLQSVYLTGISELLAGALIDLIGREARDLVQGRQIQDGAEIQPAIGLIQWEEHELEMVRVDENLTMTDREAVVIARRGQGLFKERVMQRERACRITGVNRAEHLRASHCKPWRDASNEERLDGENGLLLTPNADHLFDRGFIGFDDNGDVLVSPVADPESLTRMGISSTRRLNVGEFSQRQQHFLSYHRDNVLLRSTFLEGI